MNNFRIIFSCFIATLSLAPTAEAEKLPDDNQIAKYLGDGKLPNDYSSCSNGIDFFRTTPGNPLAPGTGIVCANTLNMNNSWGQYTDVDRDTSLATAMLPGAQVENSNRAIAMGVMSSVIGSPGGMAFGTLSEVHGSPSSIAMGESAKVIGHNPAKDTSVAIGTSATVLDSPGSVVIGQDAMARTVLDETAPTGTGVAIGAHAFVTGQNNVALGAQSVAQQRGKAALPFDGGAWSPYVVSVGDKDIKRHITNVAGGLEDDDAVNLRQLKSAATTTIGAFGGGAGLNADGSLKAPDYVVNKKTLHTVGDAIAAVDTGLTDASNRIDQLASSIGQADAGLVRQGGNGTITVGGAVGGGTVSLDGSGGHRVLTGLAAGRVAKDGADAVNGGQMYEASQSIASALGGAARVGETGAVENARFDVLDRSYADAFSAFGALSKETVRLQGEIDRIKPGPQPVAADNAVAVSGIVASASASGGNAFAAGGGAVAAGDGSTALGNEAVARGADALAIGRGAQAGFANSAAIGAGVKATGANEFALGNGHNTYRLGGLASDAGNAAQKGPRKLVTTDADGRLGTMDLGAGFPDLAGLTDRIDSLSNRVDKNTAGIAIALALGGGSLPAGKSFAISGNVATYGGSTAVGLTAIGMVTDNFYLNGGVGWGSHDTVAGRVGATWAW